MICLFLSRIFDCWHVCANGVNLAVVFSFGALDGLAWSATGQKKADYFRVDLLADSENKRKFLKACFWSIIADIRQFCTVARLCGAADWVRWMGWNGRQMGDKRPFRLPKGSPKQWWSEAEHHLKKVVL